MGRDDPAGQRDLRTSPRSERKRAMDKVRILIVAGPNRGKTTIAAVIKEALTNWGFTDVSLVDIPSEAPEAKEPISQRLEATKRRPVEIRVELAQELCQRCKKNPLAYAGAKYCGAACSQEAEMGI